MKQDLYNIDWINLDGNYIHKTAIIHPNVEMGTGNWVGAYSVIGSNGEIRGKDQKAFKGKVIIGNNNIISELVTIQRPFDAKSVTHIGSDNIIMAHAHVGHDAFIGNGCEVCTGVIIGGYAIIKDGVKLKLGVTVRNRVVVGLGALVGLGSVVTKDVYTNSVVYGNPARQRETTS